MAAKISIIIPAFNAGKYIQRCLDSILQQSFREIEVLVVNDGSSDNTLEIISKYQKIDNRVIIIDKKNNGVSSARNDALDIVSGEWIVFCDADDYYLPGSLDILYKDARLRDDIDLVLGNAVLEKVGSKNGIKYPSFKEKKIVEIFECSPCAEIWGYLFRTELIKKNKIRFDTCISYAEDKLFLWRYLLHVRYIIEEPNPVYFYSFNCASVTKSLLKNEKKTRDVFHVAKCLLNCNINDGSRLNLINKQAKRSIYHGIHVYLEYDLYKIRKLYCIYREFFSDKALFIRLLIKFYIFRAYMFFRKNK